jgi:hypothetical protein
MGVEIRHAANVSAARRARGESYYSNKTGDITYGQEERQEVSRKKEAGGKEVSRKEIGRQEIRQA